MLWVLLVSRGETDVQVDREGGLLLFALLTEKAREWVGANVPDESTWWCGRLVVEHRYAVGLAAAMQRDGLRVV